MKTITVCCYRRPEYVRRCLLALARCRTIEQWQVIVSVDAPADANVADQVTETVEMCRRLEGALPGAVIFEQELHAGVAEHPRSLYDIAFDALGSDFNVAVEEDAVLSPDALELADRWHPLGYADGGYLHGWDRLFLALGGATIERADASVIHVVRHNPSPWAWAFSEQAWRTIRPHWNCKTVSPTGWDWSLAYTMAVNNWTALAPALPRALNIGRENGEHGGAEYWDATFAGTVASDGGYTGPYRIEDSGEPRWKPWMDAEKNAHAERVS